MPITTSLDLINSGLPFTRQQAADIGLPRHAIEEALREGAVRRVLHRVYVDAHAPDCRDLRCQALQLVMPPYGVLFGTTAAWASGIDAFQPEERFLLVPHCVVPHGLGRTRVVGVKTVEGYISAPDIMEQGGLRLTVPDRTTVDMLRRLRRPFALAAADAMSHAALTSPEAIRERLPRLRGYPGIRQARQLAWVIEPRLESMGESCLHLRLLDAGFPRPEPQYCVYDRLGRAIYRLDLAYPHLLIACEYDGAVDHTSDEDRAADASRRADLHERWAWRFAIARKGDVFGSDPWIERTVGEWLGREPVLPRLW